MSELSVSVVSYRTPALLRSCLLALEQAASEVALDVTVVDNASGDGSAEMVEAEFGWVRLIRNQRNVGFGVAHNAGLRASSAEFLLVLNSDAAPRPGALRRMVEFLRSQRDVAVVGPLLRYPDGRVQPSRRRFPTVAALFVESTQLQRFFPGSGVLRRFYVADRSDDEEQDVDWLVGACLCVRAQAAAEVGLFDERFFLYSEELDWCRRFKAAGWRVVFLPSAEVEHLEGASSRQDLTHRDRHFQASKLTYARKWHGPRVAAALRAYLFFEYVFRFVEESLKLRLGSQVGERRERLRVIGSGLRAMLR